MGNVIYKNFREKTEQRTNQAKIKTIETNFLSANASLEDIKILTEALKVSGKLSHRLDDLVATLEGDPVCVKAIA